MGAGLNRLVRVFQWKFCLDFSIDWNCSQIKIDCTLLTNPLPIREGYKYMHRVGGLIEEIQLFLILVLKTFKNI